jgi:hypothetical protein
MRHALFIKKKIMKIRRTTFEIEWWPKNPHSLKCMSVRPSVRPSVRAFSFRRDLASTQTSWALGRLFCQNFCWVRLFLKFQVKIIFFFFLPYTRVEILYLEKFLRSAFFRKIAKYKIFGHFFGKNCRPRFSSILNGKDGLG